MAGEDLARELIAELRGLANPANVEGMARFGISATNTLGVSIPTLRAIARRVKRNHEAAEALWASGVHEARILAALIADPSLTTEEQLDRWVLDFGSWDVCDQCCMNLFDRTPFAFRKAAEWSAREEEFVKRAGFALMAALASHAKQAGDEAFLSFLPLIRRESGDDRNLVKKAVNWALRGIGKRNLRLNRAAVAAAEEIRALGTRSARWIAADALRELTSEAVHARLRSSAPRRQPTSPGE